VRQAVLPADSPPTHNRAPALAVVAATAGTIVGLGLADGGFFVETWTWATFALVWVLAMVVLLRDRLVIGDLELLFVAAAVALAIWAAASATWSGDYGESIREGERVLLYAVATLVVVLLEPSRSVRYILQGVFTGTVVVVGVGLVRYLFLLGDRPPDPFEGYLLHWPVGYANALGALAALGLVLALGLAMAGPRGGVEISVALVAPLSAALYLSGSDGALASCLAATIVLLVLAPERSWRIAGVGATVSGAAVWLSARADLDHARPRFDSSSATALGLQLAALTLLAAVGARIACRPPETVRREVTRRRRLWALPVIAVLAVAIVGGLRSIDGIPRVSLRPRIDYWEVAWEQWQANWLLGGGAGSFGEYWRAATGLGARDAHNLYLETLAELGPVGLVLLLLLLVTPLVAGAYVHRRPYVAIALAGYTVLLTHAGVDWDWEMPVVALAGLYCGAAVLVATRERRRVVSFETRPWHLAAAAGMVAAAFIELLTNGALNLAR
jgi:hypothetical protein